MSLGEIAEPPKTAKLSLPGGGSLTGMVNLPRSMPEECQVNFNLMLQLSPILGNMQCVLCAMKFLKFVLDFVKLVPDVPTNPTKLVNMLTNDLPEIEECLVKCIAAFTSIPGLCPPVKDMLKLISSYLHCIVELIESIAQQGAQIQVQMGDAQGNPELLEVLDLAQQNADRAGAQALRSCEPAFDLLQAAGAILEIVGVGAIALPSLDQLSGGEIGQAVQPIKDVSEVIDLIVAALPC
jgi:hypothetical protein